MEESSTTATATASIFDDCDDSCGWIAAVVAALAYGSYGVPIKETVQIDVHPLVLQSFKSFTMFVMCWFVRLLGVKAAWTPWGLVSGLLWVIGGTCGVYAIRAAGMAVAVGTWASTMICVNFYWGIVVFKEPVADFWGAVGAFVCLGIGLVGMSHFSAPREKEKVEEEQEMQLLVGDQEEQDEDDTSRPSTSSSTGRLERRELALRQDQTGVQQKHVEESPSSADIDVSRLTSSSTVVVLGYTLSKRIAGLVAAVLNGLFAGSSLIPVHYTKQHGFAGANYIISFAVGALTANTALWLVVFLYYYCTRPLAESKIKQAYECMPHWHLRELWLPGLMAGKMGRRVIPCRELESTI
jgi:hypothetical protein